MTTDPLDRARLAELDAGLPDEAEAARLRARAEADPRSAAVLDALAATKADLAGHRAPPVPAEVAQRWASALADAVPTELGPTEKGPTEKGPTEKGPAELGPAEKRPEKGPEKGPTDVGTPVPRIAPRRRRAPRPALIAAAVLVVATVVVGILQSRPGPDGPRITHAELVANARAAVGVGDAGELADPIRRAACLRSVAPARPAPVEPLIGARTVVYEGRPGVLLLLPTGELSSLRIVVVDHGCHALLADENFER